MDINLVSVGLILDIMCFNGILKMDGFVLKNESNWNLIVSLYEN